MNRESQDKQDEWIGLDAAARANLSGRELEQFFVYRDSLRAEGHLWINDAEDILRGHIWDASDGE